uniref:Putative secreted protein n=1 Tax=Ixodes scapularis TaxID=6945 RepID=A0A4D5RWS4_IXOSC
MRRCGPLGSATVGALLGLLQSGCFGASQGSRNDVSHGGSSVVCCLPRVVHRGHCRLPSLCHSVPAVVDGVPGGAPGTAAGLAAVLPAVAVQPLPGGQAGGGALLCQPPGAATGQRLRLLGRCAQPAPGPEHHGARPHALLHRRRVHGRRL